MQEEIELTRDFLVESDVSEKALKEFDKRFPNGSATSSKILKFCEELNLFALGKSLIRKLPKNPEPLVLAEYSGGNLFYNGKIYIKKGVECLDTIICQKLFVNGDLVLGENAEIYGDVDAKTLDMSGNAEIYGDVDAKTLDMSGNAEIYGYVDAKTVDISEAAEIYGYIDAKTVDISELAVIHRDVDAKDIDISGLAEIRGDVDAKDINMSEGAQIHGDVDAKTLNMSGDAAIHGDDDAKTLNMSEN